MRNLEQTREKFQKDYFATEVTGIVIDDVAERYAKCRLNLDKRHMNANNNVMGGVIFTLADFTFAVAANYAEEVTVSLNSSISYLNVVKGDCLFAEARCIKCGRSTCCYQIDIKDNFDILIATVMATGFVKQI